MMRILGLLCFCLFCSNYGCSSKVPNYKAELLRKMMKMKHVKEGALRLVGGKYKNEGNVLIFHKGRWGGICDDEWDIRDAKVACFQLGYDDVYKPTFSSHYGKPKVKFWMDNLYCQGTENSLALCRFDGWGNNDCTKEEAAGVICIKSKESEPADDSHQSSVATTVQPPLEYKPKIKELSDGEMKLRLNGGRVKDEGRVEVQQSPSQEWGAICGDGWSLLEATVVCKQLNLGYAYGATQNHFINDNNNRTVILSGVSCRGNESSIAECTTSTSLYCPGDYIAGVMCTEGLADLIINGRELEKSAYLEDRQMYLLQCAMEENCLGSSAYSKQIQSPETWHLETRRLLRFTAKILNIGTKPFRPFIPKHLWQFHQCHMHYHSMEVFATFDILNHEGKRVAEGHKASFCLEDNECLIGATPNFACANYGDQGISPNCTDVYKHNIDCQWVDISDIEPGQYIFKVSINPEFKVPEMTFENNAAVCTLLYTATYAKIYDCYITRP